MMSQQAGGETSEDSVDRRTANLGKAALALAALTLAIGWLASHFSLFHYRPGGGMFSEIIAPAVLGLYTIGFLVALRSKTLGGLICIPVVATALPMVYQQLSLRQALPLLGALGLAAVGWFLAGLQRHHLLITAPAVVLVLTTSVIGFRTVWNYHQRQWGPAHTESTAQLQPSDVVWAWVGGVTTDHAIVTVKAEPASTLRLAYSTDPAMASLQFAEQLSFENEVASFSLDGLQADTEYHYAVEVDDELDAARTGRFSTFAEGPASFVLAFGSCARTGSNGSVFDTIRGHDPLMYLITGDFFYADIPDNNPERFEEAFDVTLTAPSQSELYRSTSIGYVWDDHDFGPNNSDATSDSRDAALSSYRRLVPSYPLAGPTTTIHQAFTVGRVRIVMVDSRSARIKNETMLGTEQKEWLIDELVESSKTHAVVIWLNPDPWVGESGSDYWAEFPKERAELSQVIADNDINNLVMISGDAHMIALDDGTNTNYSTKPGKGFPVLHAAALDRPGGTQGGPYTGGVFPGPGQFGLVKIFDDGDEVSVVLEGRDSSDEVLTSLRFEPEMPADLKR